MAKGGDAERSQDAQHAHDIDWGGLVRAARRRLVLDQRSLATRVGVGKSTIARIESGAARPAPGVLARILALAGWRMAVLDEQGEEVDPFDTDEEGRDFAGRRFPAHRWVFRWTNEQRPQETMVVYQYFQRIEPVSLVDGSTADDRTLPRPDGPTLQFLKEDWPRAGRPTRTGPRVRRRP